MSVEAAGKAASLFRRQRNPAEGRVTNDKVKGFEVVVFAKAVTDRDQLRRSLPCLGDDRKSSGFNKNLTQPRGERIEFKPAKSLTESLQCGCRRAAFKSPQQTLSCGNEKRPCSRCRVKDTGVSPVKARSFGLIQKPLG